MRGGVLGVEGKSGSIDCDAALGLGGEADFADTVDNSGLLLTRDIHHV